MNDRYCIGFRSEGMSSVWTDANPGYEPIVDTKSPFAFGVVVALVDGKQMAERIVRLLNAAEPD